METNIKNSKPKVLFIADKWCAGNSAFGKAEWENNLWQSLETTDQATVKAFHLDEYHELHGHRGDEALLREISSWEPDMICIVLYKMPGSDVNVPLWETLKEIRDVHKVPMLAIWGDLEIQEQIDISKAMLPYVTLNIATASSAALARIGMPEKYLYMWVPKDSQFFNDPEKERTINVSYVGSPKKDRLKRINYLRNNGIPVESGGGERQEHRTTEAYAETFKHSKISLSFSRAHVSHVINARPFELMLCGAMMIEQENFETPKLYIPYVDYVPYRGNDDLLRKVAYYLSHDTEREKIAKNGRDKTRQLYSAERFWKIALQKMLNIPMGETYDFEYNLKPDHIALLPYPTQIKLRFLDTISSFPITFSIYKVFHTKYWEAHLFGLFKSMRVSLESRLSPKLFDRLVRLKRKYFNIF